MKTKVYKLKEHISRYLYKYLGRDDMSIYFDKSVGSWVICNKNKILDNELLGKSLELIDLVGIKIRFACPTEYTTLLWDKKKEEKYLKICKEQKTWNYWDYIATLLKDEI